MWHKIRLPFLLFTILMIGGTQTPAREAEQNRIGAENHPKMLAQFGGLIEDERIATYVREVGMALVQHTSQADEDWHFYVLDSPTVNAWALPGGYIYVTRGLLALANDEAELAAVLSHEIAHVTAEHLVDREAAGGDALKEGLLSALIGGLLSDGDDRLGDAVRAGVVATISYLGEFSQEQELEADRLGIAVLGSAGYDPLAQASFLESLSAQHALDSQIAGREYNPNVVEFFSTHPADNDRIFKAHEIAAASQFVAPLENRRDAYLSIIDGMIYGDSPGQGFVRQNGFFHPKMRFAFPVPEDFVITNSAQAVRARGPEGSTMILTGGRAPSGDLQTYLTRGWIPEAFPKEADASIISRQDLTIDGLDAATVLLTYQGRDGQKTARLTVIRRDDFLFRISGTYREETAGIGEAIFDAMMGFQDLERWEAELLQPYRLRVYEVQEGDTISSLANMFPFWSFQEDRFRTLNGLEYLDSISPGDIVKLIVE